MERSLMDIINEIEEELSTARFQGARFETGEIDSSFILLRRALARVLVLTHDARKMIADIKKRHDEDKRRKK